MSPSGLRSIALQPYSYPIRLWLQADRWVTSVAAILYDLVAAHQQVVANRRKSLDSESRTYGMSYVAKGILAQAPRWVSSSRPLQKVQFLTRKSELPAMSLRSRICRREAVRVCSACGRRRMIQVDIGTGLAASSAIVGGLTERQQ